MSWASKIIMMLFVGYIAKSVHVFYNIFHYKGCNNEANPAYCIHPFIYPDSKTGKWPPVQLRIYYNDLKMPNWNNVIHLYTKKDLNLSEPFEETIKLNVSVSARHNGTMQAYIVIVNNNFEGDDFDEAEWMVKDTIPLTHYQIPKAETFNLISNEATNPKRSFRPVSHLRSVLPVNFVTESPILDVKNIPDEVVRYIYLIKGALSKQVYLPLMDLDEMRIRPRDFVEIKSDSEQLNLTISYLPVSFGRFRMSATMKMTFKQFASLGFSEQDIDHLKGIFADINFYFLALTVVISMVHMLFDYLTFKNDISFWKGRKTMIGISTKTLIWRCFSNTVIFFYLLDENTSYLVLIPAGISTVIEFWKLRKALKISIEFNGWKPQIKFGEANEEEKRSGAFDIEGTIYLGYLLIPLCIAGAIYNLIYVPQRSWTSWTIKCLANCIYAFGFLFMLPQLFINYKLKSVAHLPWRAFCYKAFNTFIDDIFAFIITMPTSHRIACFRDDIVFFIYLYQRYLYPVDKSQVNEFGEAFDGETIDKKKTE